MAPKGGQDLPVTTEQISCTCGSEDKTVGKSSVLPTPPWLLLLRQQNVAGSGTSRDTILQSFSFHIFFFFSFREKYNIHELDSFLSSWADLFLFF